MNDAMTIAASGMQAAMRAFTSHAVNIVNAETAGPAAQTPNPGSVYAPASLIQGVVPDVVREMVGAAEAANSFRANLAVFQASSRMSKSLLDIAV